MERENMWKQYSPEQLAELEEVSSRYKECLNLGKTERECVALAISMAEAKGYKNLQYCIAGREQGNRTIPGWLSFFYRFG